MNDRKECETVVVMSVEREETKYTGNERIVKAGKEKGILTF